MVILEADATQKRRGSPTDEKKQRPEKGGKNRLEERAKAFNFGRYIRERRNAGLNENRDIRGAPPAKARHQKEPYVFSRSSFTRVASVAGEALMNPSTAKLHLKVLLLS